MKTQITLNIGLSRNDRQGENTIAGTLAALAGAVKLENVKHRLSQGSWEGVPENTLVISCRCDSAAWHVALPAVCRVLAQDSIAILFADGDGKLYGSNRNGWAFDLAQFIQY